MSRPVQFNRPVEYDPSLIRQQQHLLAQQQAGGAQSGRGAVVSKERAMKDQFGFDAEEHKEPEDPLERSKGCIRHVQDNEEELGADEEELERLAEQVQTAREAQMRAESSARRAEERIEELQRMSKQAKAILVKQFKDQINSLLAELDDQKSMLQEDDETISTLRQALARWEHGDHAAALDIQSRIKNEHDARELNRQLKQLETHTLLREKQMLDLKDELTRLQQTKDPGPRSPTAGGSNAGEELGAAQRRIAGLEREVTELGHKLREAQHRCAEAEHQKSRRESELDVAGASERGLLVHKIAQLEAAMALHKRIMETQQREVDEAKAAAAVAKSATPAPAPTPNPVSAPVPVPVQVGPSAREQELELELRAMTESLSNKDAELKRKDEELRQVKDKAKDKLNIASDAVKKMKTEYANLRAAYTKLKQESATVQSEMNARTRSQLHRVQQALQLVKSDLNDVRVQSQAMAVSLPSTMKPIVSRHFHSLHDHFSAEVASLTVAYRKEQSARKSLFNTLQELKGNIRVYCRVRPLSVRERESGDQNGITFGTEREQLSVINPEKKSTHNFEFDHVFAPTSTQDEVFSEVSDLVTSVLDGYNVCILAYGQTGSGKTFTMSGSKEDPGVNIRALDRLFVVAGEREIDTEHTINISLMEIYNEKIHDLLSSNPSTPLKPIQTPQGMTAQDLTHLSVHCKDAVLEALEKGSKNRKVSATAMNADSSRSHLILSVYVTGKSRFVLTNGATRESTGKLHLIDLAGSERVSRSGVTGEGLKEAQAINSSLSALGNCIAARANKAAHVPYRDSALTYLLQDSLEKNSKTLMFVQVSPSTADAGESICSLRFAERVRKVELGKVTANVKKT